MKRRGPERNRERCFAASSIIACASQRVLQEQARASLQRTAHAVEISERVAHRDCEMHDVGRPMPCLTIVESMVAIAELWT